MWKKGLPSSNTNQIGILSMKMILWLKCLLLIPLARSQYMSVILNRRIGLIHSLTDLSILRYFQKWWVLENLHKYRSSCATERKSPKLFYASIEKNIENSELFYITGKRLIGSRRGWLKRAENRPGWLHVTNYHSFLDIQLYVCDCIEKWLLFVGELAKRKRILFVFFCSDSRIKNYFTS